MGPLNAGACHFPTPESTMSVKFFLLVAVLGVVRHLLGPYLLREVNAPPSMGVYSVALDVLFLTAPYFVV